MSPDFADLFPGLALGASAGVNAALARLGRHLNWYDPSGAPSAGSPGFDAGASGAATEAGHPRPALKSHSRPIPFLGGPGVLAVVALGAVAVSRSWPAVWLVLAAAVPPFAVGIWDDFRWKSASVPLPKLGLQALASLLAAAGLLAARIWTGFLPPAAGAAVAALLVLGAVNSYNLADGMDGLCAGLALVSALGLAVALRLLDRPGPAALGLALGGALAGFLFLNWHPAHLFLGDGGSHLCGALLAGLGLCAARTLPALAGVVLILGLPVLDAAGVMLRRLRARRPVFAGDRRHVYDLIHARGVSVPGTVLLVLAGHALLVAAGVLLIVWRKNG